MSVPSDKEIRKAASAILKKCDISKTTLKIVRTQLEQQFGCDLKEKKELIYESFEKFLAKSADLIKYNEVVEAESEQLMEEEFVEEPVAKKKSKGGFAAEVHLATDLAEFLGVELLPRTEVTKRLWAYIKEKDLQDPADKRTILCDAALKKVLKRDKIHMFTMTKAISTMMMKPNEVNLGIKEEYASDEDTEKRAKKAKKDKKADKKADKQADKKADKKTDKKRKQADDDGNDNGSKAKKAKTQSAYTISEKLAGLLGLQRNDTRYQVVAKMWEYIRGNSLQNPADKRTVVLDKALQDVFKVKTFTIFSMNKHISEQMVKN